MKKEHVMFSLFSCILIVVTLCTTETAQCQKKFTKHSANPVLTTGPAGSWDADIIFSGSVLYHDSAYLMWYCGTRDSATAIGLAYSQDGMAWTKCVDNPVLVPGGSIDFDARLGGCSVLYYSGMFHMWYNGGNAGTVSIGYASSADGIHWMKHPGAVFAQSNVDAQRGIFGGVGPVVKEETSLKMFPWGRADSTWWMTCLATSRDSVSWERCNEGAPVFVCGEAGAWDDHSRAAGTVLRADSCYEMWYDNAKQAPFAIGYAWSTDSGAHWTASERNPIVRGDPGAWDGLYAIQPMVVRRPDGKYHLYYTGGRSRDSAPAIGLAIEDAPSVDTLRGADTISVPTTQKKAEGELGDTLLFAHRLTAERGGTWVELPTAFALLQNSPNPFNPTTTIRYALPHAARVRLDVYTVLGQKVKELVNEEQAPGWKTVQWHVGDRSSGVYFYRLQAGEYVRTIKMIVVK